MIKDILITIESGYKKQESKIVIDENPINFMSVLIDELLKEWGKVFSDKADSYTDDFITEVDNHTKHQLNSMFKEFLGDKTTIKFDKTARNVLNAKKAVIKENVNLIKSIPGEMLGKVYTSTMQAMSRGRDMQYLYKQIMRLGESTERRAKLIARDQLNKATSVINHARQLDAGITKNTWYHSSGGKKPRPSHVAFNGETYDVAAGAKIDGEYIFPGQLINCRCTSAPYIELS